TSRRRLMAQARISISERVGGPSPLIVMMPPRTPVRQAEYLQVLIASPARPWLVFRPACNGGSKSAGIETNSKARRRSRAFVSDEVEFYCLMGRDGSS